MEESQNVEWKESWRDEYLEVDLRVRQCSGRRAGDRQE